MKRLISRFLLHFYRVPVVESSQCFVASRNNLGTFTDTFLNLNFSVPGDSGFDIHELGLAILHHNLLGSRQKMEIHPFVLSFVHFPWACGQFLAGSTVKQVDLFKAYTEGSPGNIHCHITAPYHDRLTSGDRKLVAEIRRMLMDSKADALVENFAAQWLFLRELDSVTPDAADFDENLRLAMTEETHRLFAAVMHDDLSVIRLLDAEFTYLNDRLAEHYGINDIHGSYFRRVDLPLDSPRRGK